MTDELSPNAIVLPLTTATERKLEILASNAEVQVMPSAEVE